MFLSCRVVMCSRSQHCRALDPLCTPPAGYLSPGLWLPRGTSYFPITSFAVVTVPTYIARAQKHLVFRALLSFPLVSRRLPGAVPLAAALGNPRVKSSFVKPLFDNVRAGEQQQGPRQTRQQGLRKRGYLLDFTWGEQNGPTAHHLHATGCCGGVQQELVGK